MSARMRICLNGLAALAVLSVGGCGKKQAFITLAPNKDTGYKVALDVDRNTGKPTQEIKIESGKATIENPTAKLYLWFRYNAKADRKLNCTIRYRNKDTKEESAEDKALQCKPGSHTAIVGVESDTGPLRPGIYEIIIWKGEAPAKKDEQARIGGGGNAELTQLITVKGGATATT